jgi:hypothetical protein
VLVVSGADSSAVAWQVAGMNSEINNPVQDDIRPRLAHFRPLMPEASISLYSWGTGLSFSCVSAVKSWVSWQTEKSGGPPVSGSRLLTIKLCHATPTLEVPYAWVFWGLRSKVSAHTTKKALAVAFGCGSLILVLFSSLLAVTSFDVDRQMAIVYALVVLLQIALLVGTMKAYYSMDQEPRDLKILATRLWVPVVGIAAVVIILPNLLLFRERAPYEASAVGSLRTINVAQVEYARTHPDRGFASSLTELGPGSDDPLIDSVLASGGKSSYIFILTAAPPNSHGRIVRYGITARPQHYGKNIKHNFFTDESGVLRFTTENRAATAHDPALQ